MPSSGSGIDDDDDSISIMKPSSFNCLPWHRIVDKIQTITMLTEETLSSINQTSMEYSLHSLHVFNTIAKWNRSHQLKIVFISLCSVKPFSDGINSINSILYRVSAHSVLDASHNESRLISIQIIINFQFCASTEKNSGGEPIVSNANN